MPARALWITLLLLALAAPSSRADEADVALARWLATAKQDPERWAPEVVERRRALPDLVGRLLRLAYDPAVPLRVRERAIDLLGSSADGPGLAPLVAGPWDDPGLGPASLKAQGRLTARERVQRGLVAVGQGQAGALQAAARAAVGDDARELVALARDPLLAPHPRCAVLAVLGAAGPEQGIDDVLAAVAGEARGEVLEACLDALAPRPNPQALAAGLAALLRRGALDAGERALLARFVARLRAGEGVKSFVRRAFADGGADPDAARAAAARALGAAEQTEAIDKLAALLAVGELTRALRVALVSALLRLRGYDAGKFGDAAPLLVEAALGVGLEAKDAVEGLARLPAPSVEAALAAALPNAEAEGRARAFDVALALRLEGMAAAAAEAAQDESTPWVVRLAAVQALPALSGPESRAVAPLVHLLGLADASPDAVVLRRAAAEALGALEPTPETLEAGRAALEAALGDEASTVRRAALRALTAWADPRSAPAIAGLLARPARTTDERLARAEAARRLGLVDADAATRVLGVRTEDKDPVLALALVDYARLLPDRSALLPLVELLPDHAAEVREAALGELHRRGCPGFGLDPRAPPSTQADALEQARAWATERSR